MPDPRNLLSQGFILPEDDDALVPYAIPAPMSYVTDETPIEYAMRSPEVQRAFPTRAETEASDARANEAYNAQVRASRNPSQRAAQRLFENAVRGAEAETGVDYNPNVLANRALDVPLLGLSDELEGAIAAGIDPELDYADAQHAIENANAWGAREYPWSARIGSAAGMAAALPLTPLMEAAPGMEWARAAGQGAVGAGVPAAAMGGFAGFQRSRPGHELEDTVTGAVTAGVPAAAGGAMTRGGSAYAAANPYIGRLLQGAGVGLTALPAMSSHTVLEPGEMALEAPEALAAGAAFGLGGHAAGQVLGAPARFAGALQEELANLPARPVRQRVPGAPVDEALLDGAPFNEEDAIIPEVIDNRPAAEIAQEAANAEGGRSLFSRAIRGALSENPVYARFRSAGVLERPQIRRLVRAFGGEANALQALRDAGLARPGIYSRSSQVEGARAVRPAMQDRLANVHRQVEADARPIAGERVAQNIEAIAPDYEYGSASDREARIAEVLRDRAQDFRYGRGNRPQMLTEGLYPDTDLFPRETVTEEALLRGRSGRFERAEWPREETLEVLPIDEAEVAMLPPDRSLSYRELRRGTGGTHEGGMAAQAQANRAAYSGSPAALTSEQEAGVDLYRAMQSVRDEEIAATLGEEGYGRYLDDNAAFRVADIIANPEMDINAARAPQAALGQIGGIGSRIGRVFGEAQQRLIGNYRDSILATINEVGTHADVASLPRVARLLEQARTLPNARALGAQIESAVRQGTLAQLLAGLEGSRTDQVADRATSERAATPEAQQSEARMAEQSQAERNARFRARMSPEAAARTVETPASPEDAQVEAQVNERGRAFRERMRRGRNP